MPELPVQGGRFVRRLGLTAAVALVVGNMAGTSLYTLPASLAGLCGPLGLVAWLVTAVGYLFVTRTFARLGPLYPRTGGPYVFVRAAFGDFAGFVTVWAYWASVVVGNAAIAIGGVGYLTSALGWEGTALERFVLAQALVWGLAVLNILGVAIGARVQIVLLALNVVPLVLVSIAMLPSFDAEHLVPFAPHGWSALPVGAAYIVWAYSGIESITIPAEEVASPATTIRRATWIGYALGTLVFLLSAVAVAGALPNDALAAESARPVAAAAEHALGPWAGTLVSVMAVAAVLGVLNGWTLLLGRIPVAAAQDGLFFESLARIHPRFGTPHAAILAGSAVGSAFLFALLEDGLLSAFNTIAGLSVFLALLVYIGVALADFALAGRAEPRLATGRRRRVRASAMAGLLFLLFGLWGLLPTDAAAPNTWLWGGVALAVGLPLYPLVRRAAVRGRG